MKEIKLTQGKVALVDDEDYNFLNQWKWYAHRKKNKGGNIYYARNKSMGFMHRLILKTPTNLLTDHKDHNGLNNQKNNIRICNNSQSRMNVRAYGKSKYLGVNIIHTNRKYKYITAEIRTNGKRLHLGTFKTEEAAALVYNEAAIKYHGEFANINRI